jgi:hypothetical protein
LLIYSHSLSRGARATDLIAGAASSTIGNIVIQAINQDPSQFRKKSSVANDGKLAMPANRGSGRSNRQQA